MLSIKAKKGGGDDGEESFDNDDEDDVDANGGMERNERVVVECRDRYRDRRRGRWVDDYSRRRGIDARGGRGLDDASRYAGDAPSRSTFATTARWDCLRRWRRGRGTTWREDNRRRSPMAHHARDSNLHYIIV